MRKKTQTYMISKDVTTYALIQNPTSIRPPRVNANTYYCFYKYEEKNSEKVEKTQD